MYMGIESGKHSTNGNEIFLRDRQKRKVSLFLWYEGIYCVTVHNICDYNVQNICI